MTDEQDILDSLEGLLVGLAMKFPPIGCQREDLFQVARLKAVECIRCHDASRGELTTLVTVAVRRALTDELRRTRSILSGGDAPDVLNLDHPCGEGATDTYGDLVPDDGPSVERQVLGQAEAARLLALVPIDRNREVVVRVVINGEAQDVVAADLGVSRTRVHHIIARSLRRMRRGLTDD